MSEYYYLSSDNKTNIHCVSWEPIKEPKAVLLIVHGMCESIMRYADFASTLAKEGYYVAGHDQLGHGQSVESEDDYGYFAKEDGNKCLLDDIEIHRQLLAEAYPNTPLIILGHSMGSFLTRQYLCSFGEKLNGAIIIGTGVKSGFILSVGEILTKFLASFYGWHHRSKLINAIAFGSYNKRIKNAKTRHDWLTKDEKIVKKFIESKDNNYIFTLNGFLEMFKSIGFSQDPIAMRTIPKDLPMLFMSGEDDPVGDYGKGVKIAASYYENNDILNIKTTLYKGDRHEILNELDRVVVYNDIMNWIDEVIEL